MKNKTERMCLHFILIQLILTKFFQQKLHYSILKKNCTFNFFYFFYIQSTWYVKKNYLKKSGGHRELFFKN